MKISILSDSHDHIALLDAAAARSAAEGVEAIIHCGDVVAPSTLHCLEKHGIPTHVIHGNNSGDLYTLGRLAARPMSVIRYHGMDAALLLGGRRIFVVHYPHYARAMATTGDWDLVCCGHTHEVEITELPNLRGTTTTLINPGTAGGVGKAPATLIIGDTDTLSFRVITLDKKLEYESEAAETQR